MEKALSGYRGGEASVVWESIKFDGSPHRVANSIDLGTTEAGRWLLIEAGTPVSRPHGRSYDHPCDAVALIPTSGLWTATWLVDWDPVLYVDVARILTVEPDHITTMDLDVDVVRRRSNDVEILDLDEFEHHRRSLGYPNDLVVAVRQAAEDLAAGLRSYRTPFHEAPQLPPPDAGSLLP